MPVDGNIERVVSRLFAVEEPLPQAKPLIQQLAATLLGAVAPAMRSRAGDSAQALMDLGATICTPKKPACVLCPLNEDCVGARRAAIRRVFRARRRRRPANSPRRGVRRQARRRTSGASRPEKGLLGGMTEVPTSDWLPGQDDAAARKQAPELKGMSRWHRKAGVVTHVFTHFPLELVVYAAHRSRAHRAPEGMRWVPIATLDGEALPNVMRKVIAHGLGLRASVTFVIPENRSSGPE